MERNCTFEAERADEGMRIVISGELMANTAPDVEVEIDAIGDELAQGSVVFDLAGLENVSSAGSRRVRRGVPPR